MKGIIQLIRPHQWVKNLFVFIPLFFSGNLLNSSDLWASLITFAAFSLVASAVYCFNDIIDVEADRKHARKRMRPIASGAVSITSAYIIMMLMLLLSAGFTLLLGGKAIVVGGVLLGYFVLNLAYCLWLKQLAIVDVCIVAFGFVLRIIAGGLATDVHLSKWIVLMTFLLTLFMSFAKRRDDVVIMNETGETPRKNTIKYNITFINQAITIVASVMLVCYIMYTVSPEVIQNFHTPYLYLTSVFVLLGLLRYMQITLVDEDSGDPTKIILRDKFTQIVVFAWGLSFLLMIYVL